MGLQKIGSRLVVLDTETTGLNPRTGDRIIEIGCVEMIDRRLTGNNYHQYINPERDSEEGALAVHGLTTEFLSDKPKFRQIAAEFKEYISGAELIIHNAPFDMGFLDAEFKRLDMAVLSGEIDGVIDTLVQAKEMYPGKRNSLDALCDRYGISNAHRTLHGALLDSELLAEVYLAMTRGQNSFSIDFGDDRNDTGENGARLPLAPLEEIFVRLASVEEILLHEDVLVSLNKEVRGLCVWHKLPAEVAQE
ncbi:DNA polymerase III subunit epsilon [Glaciimonas immobilis]|uniref:DNA polymerase III subunit epsilon n=1 Tax=Glaciimonas immobilis TaxID=728004 RepID=A0A840RQL4_9BURK|nr:DNA polymerase III subunit epsilon [Glaciimonas immobilis]KAF3998029.1 DNA polymerase III subunit epsilon [Glaciimonas immobilis]MBB5199286.1 DNA polymerase-3 subunit epsilon [Glaciimonas immobilis]